MYTAACIRHGHEDKTGSWKSADENSFLPPSPQGDQKRIPRRYGIYSQISPKLHSPQYFSIFWIFRHTFDTHPDIFRLLHFSNIFLHPLLPCLVFLHLKSITLFIRNLGLWSKISRVKSIYVCPDFLYILPSQFFWGKHTYIPVYPAYILLVISCSKNIFIRKLVMLLVLDFLKNFDQF